MDFNAKRLALLAGVGNPDDRHVIVQEQAQQLNESIEARQASSDEEEVRKAVRRTIQKMIAEGVLDEGEGYGITGGAMHVFEDEDTVSAADLADDEEYDADEGDDDEYDLTDEEKAKRAKAQAIVRNNPVTKALKTALPENDATLMRLQKLAGVQILSEGRAEDVDEGSCPTHEDEDHMEEGELEEEMVYGVDPDNLDDPPASGYMSEEEDQEEGMIYELEEELEEITLYEQEDGQLHTTIDGVEYALVKK